jgi:hypothetical protein
MDHSQQLADDSCATASKHGRSNYGAREMHVNNRFMAMLLLTRPQAVAAAALVAQIRQLYPRYQAPLEPVSSGVEPGEPILLKAGGVTITVMFIDQPVPAGTLDAAIETDKLWLDAAVHAGGHKAHAIVTHLETTATHAEALLAAATVNVVTGALSVLLPSIGVYWASGDTVTEIGQFRESTRQLVTGTLPVETWAQFRWLDGPPTEQGERTLAVITTGLLPFLGREIEFYPVPWPPIRLATYLISFIQYLLQNGLIIGDRETFGFDEQTRIGVRHLDEGQRPGLPILALMVLPTQVTPE